MKRYPAGEGERPGVVGSFGFLFMCVVLSWAVVVAVVALVVRVLS